MMTEFVEKWRSRPSEAAEAAERLRGEIVTALREGRSHELVPFTGQTAGMIRDVRPAGTIVREIAIEAQSALERAL
jgi:enoyl-[acyl-carrier protein] reductase II